MPWNNEAFYIPWDKEKTQLEKDLVIRKLKPILEDPSIKKVDKI